jgi:hypothetical protein
MVNNKSAKLLHKNVMKFSHELLNWMDRQLVGRMNRHMEECMDWHALDHYISTYFLIRIKNITKNIPKTKTRLENHYSLTRNNICLFLS